MTDLVRAADGTFLDLDRLALEYTYSGSNIATITTTDPERPGVQYRQTLTYTGGLLAGSPLFVKV